MRQSELPERREDTKQRGFEKGSQDALAGRYTAGLEGSQTLLHRCSYCQAYKAGWASAKVTPSPQRTES